MSLEDVTKLVSTGRYEKALGLLNELSSDIFVLNIHTYNLLKGHLLVKHRQFEQALKISRELMENAKQSEDQVLFINSSLIFADAALSLYRPVEGITILQESEGILLNQLKKKSLTFQKLRAQIYELLGACFWMKGEFAIGIQYIDKSIDLANHYRFKDIVAEGYFRKGTLFRSKNDPQSLELFEKSLEIFKELGNDYYKSDVYHHIGIYYRSTHDYQLGLQYFLRSSKIRNALGNNLDLAWSYHRIGTTYKDLGNFNQSLIYLQRALSIREEFNNHESIGQTYEEIGDVYFYQGMLETSLTNLYHAYAEYVAIESDMLIGSVKNKIGRVFGSRGDFDTALIYHNDALQLLQGIDDKIGIPWSYLFIGQVNVQKNNFVDAKDYLVNANRAFDSLEDKLGLAFSELLLAKLYFHLNNDNSEKSYKKAIKLFKETNNLEGLTEGLLGYGLLLHVKGETEKSIEFFKEAESILFKYGKEHFGLINNLYRLILLGLDYKMENTSNLINLFKKIAKKQKGNERIKQKLNLIEAYELINNNRIKYLSKVRKILGKLTKEPVIDFETTILAYLNKFDLLLYETKITDKNLLFEPAEILIKEIIDFIERRNLISWLAHVYSRYALLKMLKYEFSDAKVHMLKAEEISINNNLLRLSHQIITENEKLNEVIYQVEKLKRSDEKSSLISNSINFSSIITGVGQRSEQVKLDQPDEEKIFLGILDKSGFPLFSLNFMKPADSSSDELIQDYLSTFNTLVEDLTKTKQISSKLVNNNLTYYLKTVDTFIIGYVYTGSSINAQIRINQFNRLIQNNLELYNQLTENIESNGLLNKENINSIEKIIAQLFK